jgi:hypothetical protein
MTLKAATAAKGTQKSRQIERIRHRAKGDRHSKATLTRLGRTKARAAEKGLQTGAR